MSKLFSTSFKRSGMGKPQKYTAGIFRPAITQLQNSLDVVTNNAPINEKEGNTEQAKLEKTHATSFRAAIQHLSRKK